MNISIPVNTPILSGNEKKYVSECIDSGWISSEGPYVAEFEDKFATRMGRKYGIAVSNGSVALDAAIEALNIGPGDEVIMPTFTIISCILQIIRSGASPILIDSDLHTWNMDVSQIESKITDKTKAIMVVHIYGLPVKMDAVLNLAVKYNLKIIEDAAEMHGQNYNGKPCGSFGDISTFSFYPNKHITTGEGGMILTDDALLAESCRSLRNLCFIPEKRFVHERLGWNLRMTNIQAAIGLAQLERLDDIINRKREIGALYTSNLKGVDEIQLPIAKTDYADNIYWVYGIVLDNKLKINAQQFMMELSKYGIGSRPFFYPMHNQPILNKMGFFCGEEYVKAEFLSKYGFYPPSGVGITDEEIFFVCNAIKNIIKDFR